jgi:YidC/Oxa1 family membrane protein insertase
MERRLILAFVLSFFVIVLWGRLNPFPGQTETAKDLPVSQHIENKELIENSSIPSPDNNQKLTENSANEVLSKIENEKLEISISNLGAIIKEIKIKKYASSLPITDLNDIENLPRYTYKVIEKNNNTIIYEYKDENIILIKEYTFDNAEYVVTAKTKISNKNKMSKIKNLEIAAFRLDISSLDKKSDNNREKTLLEYSISSPSKIFRKGNAFKFSDKDEIKNEEPLNWIGFRDRYFCVIYKPLFSTQMYENELKSKNILSFKTKTLDFENQTQEMEAKIYFGPQDMKILAKADKDFPQLIRFSSLGIIDFVARTMNNLLGLLFKVIPNWGICIIITALIIYWGMYPLSIKGLMSMKKMQSLQPEISKIREQYKNNPQKMQKETMELYKEYKINPLGGCFPLILQMPFFIGIYQVLWRSVAFKGANFLWIKDLSLPDRLFILPFSLPFIGQNINILPILMIFIMFFQQKFSSSSIQAADPAQQQTQKMMMFMFPLMIGFIFYNIASGLAVYFTVFYLMSTLTQWKMSKITKVF